MRLVYIALLLVGCGSDTQEVPKDLAQTTSDDFLPPGDFTMPPLPPDMTGPACSMPRSGIYNESVTFAYVPANGGMVTLSGNTQTLVVRNDGTIVRPMSTFPSPNLFHCNFTTVDTKSCFASCCPEQISSPIIYVDGGGWSLWLGGACSYQTTTGAQYIANVTNLDGYFLR